MDPTAFDALARSFHAAGSRRRLLRLLAALPLGVTLTIGLGDAPDATADAGDHGSSHRRQRRKARHRHNPDQHKDNPTHQRKSCKPKSNAQTCAGKCGRVRNRCGKRVDCGSCVCSPACPLCQTCDPATGQCVPSANRTICGGSGTTTSVCCNGTCCTGCCGESDDSCGSCLAFVTSSLHTGALGGLSGADSICQHRAGPGQGNLPGIYKAWLSIGFGPNSPAPANRFRHSQQPYRLVNGASVAANWADLTTCDSSDPFACIDNPINITETGRVTVGSVGSDLRVWTNTLTDGTAGDSDTGSASACRNWESDEAVNCLVDPSGCGAIGADFDRDEFWTDDNTIVTCDVANYRLYCFQQS